jgi:hypothetical protein
VPVPLDRRLMLSVVLSIGGGIDVIERCYCRLKDFRRIATRYDKLARNYFSALCLVAAVAFWL